MQASESFVYFQHRYVGNEVGLPGFQAGHFQAFARQNFGPVALPYNRRDFYKIALLTRGTSRLHHATRGWEITGPTLVLSNPLVPHAWETTSDEQAGLFCVFTADFLAGTALLRELLDSPLFALGREPVLRLTPAQSQAFTATFEQLLAELASDYAHKDDVLRHCLALLLHQAQKLQPPPPDFHHPTAAHRLAALFLELLARQFPLDSPARPLRLRAAQDFAPLLGVHVNYLNRAVRAVTGQTTTAHLAARRLQEAQALLRTTDWSAADIAHGLGFAYPTHFHAFFKKHTGQTPQQARAQRLAAAVV